MNNHNIYAAGLALLAIVLVFCSKQYISLNAKNQQSITTILNKDGTYSRPLKAIIEKVKDR